MLTVPCVSMLATICFSNADCTMCQYACYCTMCQYACYCTMCQYACYCMLQNLLSADNIKIKTYTYDFYLLFCIGEKLGLSA
jgi:hypothetical protein